MKDKLTKHGKRRNFYLIRKRAIIALIAIIALGGIAATISVTVTTQNHIQERAN